MRSGQRALGNTQAVTQHSWVSLAGLGAWRLSPLEGASSDLLAQRRLPRGALMGQDG